MTHTNSHHRHCTTADVADDDDIAVGADLAGGRQAALRGECQRSVGTYGIGATGAGSAGNRSRRILRVVDGIGAVTVCINGLELSGRSARRSGTESDSGVDTIERRRGQSATLFDGDKKAGEIAGPGDKGQDDEITIPSGPLKPPSLAVELAVGPGRRTDKEWVTGRGR